MSKRPVIVEDELVEGLKARSQKAFAVLYDNYGTTLLGIICKIVRDEHEAENLLQDTFVKIWRNIDQYDASKGRLFTWLLNIARNTAINFLRSIKDIEKTEIQTAETDVYTARAVVSEPSPLEYIGVAETVNQLDPKLKQVIDLIYFFGYTQQEVADRLDMPLGTVKTRTRAALQQLKQLFADE
ncbi:RNA polymerase sigma factor [Larkinella soli]|uniref:RNA polymerase sigma factor n=1 Tax=Larkinella soli TaxID=1770527 RepID=UPI001E62E714|nr:sigma-70 family RNA polymerase sigma factor [Larkinella soli]